MTNQNINFKPSFAFGGFSNVWGATIMPYTESDIIDWPINIKDLECDDNQLSKV